jgi:hypothetical protein
VITLPAKGAAADAEPVAIQKQNDTLAPPQMTEGTCFPFESRRWREIEIGLDADHENESKRKHGRMIRSLSSELLL